MAVCLTPQAIEKLLGKLEDGSINPDEMTKMTSEERHAFFADFLGDTTAGEVNALLESKLLLKNQQQGMINWAKQLTGIKPEVKNDILSKINRMDKFLNPAEEEAFLHDLASKRVGTEVTYEEAQKITELAKKAEELKAKAGESRDARITYGRAVQDLQEYVTSLKPQQQTIRGKITSIVNLPKSILASFNFSAPFIHGWGMTSRPEFWKAYAQMFKYGMSEEAYRNLMADIQTRPNADLYKKSGLRVTSLSNNLSQREEQFLSPILDKIPGLRGSERAYVGFLNQVRADVFDKLVEKAQLVGEDVTKNSQAAKDIAAVVNNFTGSASLGKFEHVAPQLNNVFFSPRKIMATVNMFNPYEYIKQQSPTARSASLRNLIGSLGVSAALLGLATVAGAKVEKDPRSSKFGKIQLGNTMVDVTGGNVSYGVFLARMLENSTKTSKGNVLQFGHGFKPETRLSVFENYLRGKLSPFVSAIVDLGAGTDVVGKKSTVSSELKEKMIPIIANDLYDTVKKDPSNAFTAALADLLGFQTKTN